MACDVRNTPPSRKAPAAKIGLRLSLHFPVAHPRSGGGLGLTDMKVETCRNQRSIGKAERTGYAATSRLRRGWSGADGEDRVTAKAPFSSRTPTVLPERPAPSGAPTRGQTDLAAEATGLWRQAPLGTQVRSNGASRFPNSSISRWGGIRRRGAEKARLYLPRRVGRGTMVACLRISLYRAALSSRYTIRKQGFGLRPAFP